MTALLRATSLRMAFIFSVTALGCVPRPDFDHKNIPVDTQAESENTDHLELIALQFFNGDTTALYGVESPEDAEIVLDFIAQMQEKETGIHPAHWTTELPDCIDTTGEYQVSVWADASDRAITGIQPTCFTQDRWDYCGDGEYALVEFDLGEDPLLSDRYLLWGTTMWSQAVILLDDIFHSENETNTRLHLLDHHGFAFVCLDIQVNPADIRLSL